MSNKNSRVSALELLAERIKTPQWNIHHFEGSTVL